jgi:hypothetical protein
MKRSFLSPEALKSFGLWLIVVALLAEALLVIDGMTLESLTPKWEKLLTALFTVAIAFGVWVEHFGAKIVDAPRRLTAEQQKEIAEKLKPFTKVTEPTPAEIGTQEAAVFANDWKSMEAVILANDIAASLQLAGWRVNRNSVTHGMSLTVSGVSLIVPMTNPRALTVAEAVIAALAANRIWAHICPLRRNGCEESGWPPEEIASTPGCSAISLVVGERP